MKTTSSPPRILFVLLLMCIALTSCKYAVPVNPTPTPIPIGTPYTYTVTIPPSVPAAGITIAGVTGLPPSIARTGFTVAGTPAWNEFGTWTVSANGTVPAGPFYKKAWKGSANFDIAPPTITPTPVAGFTIPGFGMASNAVTISVTPPGPYVINYGFASQPSGQRFTVGVPFQTSPITTPGTGVVTLVVAAQTDLPATTTLNLRIKSIAPGGTNVVTISIPVTKL